MNRIPLSLSGSWAKKCIWLIESKWCKICHKAFHEKGSFACYNGQEFRFVTVMLHGCLSYTPIDSRSNIGTICRHKE